MNQLKKVGVLLVLGLVIVLGNHYFGQTQKNIQNHETISKTGTLVRVVDGDTLIVKLDGEEERVRIIGIDAPESVRPNYPVECFGKEASDYLTSQLVPGDTVHIETDPSQDTRDRNGRILAHVFNNNDQNIGELMVSGGYTYEYTYRDPYQYQSSYQAAENYARNKKLGLWAPETCNGEN